MVIVTSSQLMQSLKLHTPPIFETILPLTETAEEIIEIQQAFRELIKAEHRLLQMSDAINHIEIIPLFEQVDKIIDSANLLRHYIKMHKKLFGFSPTYLRPYCARSDPALNSGLVPTILALKAALSSYREVEEETGVGLFPMLGTGSLPFRGGLSPERIDQVLEEYAGVATLIIQSAFRYDYPRSLVKKTIAKIKQELPKRKAKQLTDREIQAVKRIIPYFEKPYQSSIEKLAPLINLLSKKVARRRERMLHIGLFGYSRGVGNVRLPRAIPFTASLYSLGIPAEFIGTGRGIKRAKKEKLWQTISHHYLHLKDDLLSAGYFLNKENISRLAKTYPFWYDIMDDILFLEKEFGIEFGPKSAAHYEHYQITKKIYENFKEKKDISQLITLGGILRKSLG
jgi:phosphoenolpyruvate carboxylase